MNRRLQMRRIAGIVLGSVLAVAGCTGLGILPVVTVLAAGNYAGTLTCSGTRTDSAGPTAINSTLDATVAVTAAGQLSIYGDDYSPGRTLSASTGGVNITQTVDSITEDTDTVSIQTSGTIVGQGKDFDSDHDISIRQVDPTHVELIDVESSIDSGNGISVQLTCSGTLAQ
jgi:hypothetical protein